MKKVLAIMLVCFMLVSLLPMGALAEELEQETPACKGTNHYVSTCEDYSRVDHFDGKCGGYAYDVYLCNICGDYFADNFVKNSNEHAYAETTAPTCTKAGEKTCSICGDKQPIDATGHDKGDLVGNCIDGWKAVCTICGETLESKPGEHAWGERPIILVEPNEKECKDGLAKYVCTVCGAEKEVIILSHDCADELAAVEAKDPTCTKDGTLAHDKCGVCGKTFIDGIEVDAAGLVIEKLGHMKGEPTEVTKQLTLQYWWNTEAIAPHADLTITFTASLPEGGYVMIQEWDSEWGSFYAMDNGYLYNGDVVTLEFKAGVEYRVFSWAYDGGILEYTYMEGPVTVLGDCENETVCTYKCERCGEYVNELLGLNHNFAVVYETLPTCDTYGYLIESCVDCGKYSIVRTDPFGHSARPADEDLPIEYDRWGYVERENPVKPTCNNDGYYWWNCEICGEEQREVIKATGCDIITIKVDATCTEYAYSYSYCSRDWMCDNYNWMEAVSSIFADLGNDQKYEINLPGTFFLTDSHIDIAGGKNPNNHNPADKARGDVIEPTCDRDGLIIYWCTDCEKDIVETIPALGHTYGEEFTTEPTCTAPGMKAHICEVCSELEVLEWIEFNSKYVYWTYESAAECHDLEGSIKEVFKPGVCGESYGLDRYLCAGCNQYILVKDDSTLEHVKPETLLEKDDPNNQVEVPVFEPTVYTGTLSAEEAYDGHFYTFTMPCTGRVTIEIEATATVYVSGITADPDSPWYVYDEGATKSVNIWSYDACEYTVTITPYVEGVRNQEFCGKEATCTEAGYTDQYYCLRCDKFIASKTIEAFDHDIVVDVEAVDPTCNNAGCTKGYHCENCDLLVESEIIPANGHNHVLTDHAEWIDGKQFGYEHYECTNCKEGTDGHEFIKNYKSVCIHVMSNRADRDLSYAATCEKDGLRVYLCELCDAVMKEEVIARLHHKNAAGDDLEICANDHVTDRKCASCEGTFAAPAHTMGDPVIYEPNCLGDGYFMTACTKCDHYEVTNIEITEEEREALHAWSEWAPVKDDNGVIVGEKRACKVCYKIDTRDVTCIAFSATIENAANAAGTITDGSLVKVTIDLSGMEDLAWGFKFDVAYTSNMKFEKAVFVTENFTYAQVATNNTGFVTVIANANGEEEINGKESIVELYFTVTAPAISDIAISINNVDALNAEGKPVDYVAYGAEAKTVLLMELDGFAGITLSDALAAYNLIIANKYDAAADLDKDGFITLADYLYLFNYLSGAMSYDEIVALG